ncbi:hypothetical protein [Pseudolysinimonas sp.]|uniref:hypothetical protein n=1 Tax=Pseudolysinimonas sp. TaxID=2680009 RepID=UPI003C75C87F
MTEPQVWVLIGVFATAVFGMLTWQTISFNRALRTSIDSLREVMDVRFEAVNARFDAVDAKIDALDRDVQALTRHVFGTDPR